MGTRRKCVGHDYVGEVVVCVGPWDSSRSIWVGVAVVISLDLDGTESYFPSDSSPGAGGDDGTVGVGGIPSCIGVGTGNTGLSGSGIP